MTCVRPRSKKTLSQPRQTLESIQSDFDRIALLTDEDWNHKERYHGYLLSRVPARCRHILEIGCGTGGFTRSLAERAEKVLAIDLSPQMIRLARERSRPYTNIEFVNGDVMARHFPDDEFDCIATLATLHHLPVEAALRKIRKALKPGGVFVCLDLYQRSNLSDLLFDGVAYPVSLFLRLMQNGRLRQAREMREAYDEHGKTDTYPTLPQIKQICADTLPGALVSRHLFWRYSIVWKKEPAG